MNEQIKQLEKDALYFALQFRAGLNGDLTDYGTEIIFREKFAELIVRECANHCDLLLDHKISSEWSRGTHDCSRAIKKHFGVEE